MPRLMRVKRALGRIYGRSVLIFHAIRLTLAYIKVNILLVFSKPTIQYTSTNIKGMKHKGKKSYKHPSRKEIAKKYAGKNEN